MKWVDRTLPTRWLKGLAVFYILASVGVCFVPLYQSIGYDSASLFGVISGMSASFISRRKESVTLAAISPTETCLREWSTHLLLLTIPFTILTLNGFRVLNCDYRLGLQFWLAIPVISALIGVATRMVALTIAERTVFRLFFALGVILVSVAYFAWRLATEPPIIGFQLHLGYFSGSIYDEGLALPSPLVWYRLICVLGVIFVVSSLEGLWRWRTSRAMIWAVSASLLALGLCLGALSVRESRGVDISADYVAQDLGGVVESENFVIYYSRQGAFAKDVKALVEDHEFRYHELKAFFETDPVATSGKKVRSYVYASQNEKGRLMGGRRTLVARLWLGEMHITWRHFGDNILAHELAHIFTEPFGTGPLKLSTRAIVGVNMGLVEGIAVAADWPPGEFTPHEATAALRRLDAAPDIRRLVGASGFWSQSSSRAYTVTGSFIKYLVDTRGIEALKQAYGHGEFERVYGVPLHDLALEWETFLDALELDESLMEVARFIYDRPSIFQKVCARVLADLRHEANEWAGQGQTEKAAATLRKVLSYDPNNVAYHMEYSRFLADIGLDTQAFDSLTQVSKMDLGPVQRSQVEELHGDLLWRSSKYEAAAAHYKSCLAQGLPLERRRLVGVKKSITEMGDPRARWGGDYLIRNDSEVEPVLAPMEWLSAYPTDPLVNYLVARRHLSAKRYKDALKRIGLSSGLEDDLLNAEIDFMGAQAAYRAGQFDTAAAFISRMRSSQFGYYRVLSEEWQERLEWKKAKTIGIE